MDVKLIQGSFSQQEALDLLQSMISVKIKFHEGKINSSSNEEDIKMRENRIKALQHELATIRHRIKNGLDHLEIKSIIEIN